MQNRMITCSFWKIKAKTMVHHKLFFSWTGDWKLKVIGYTMEEPKKLSKVNKVFFGTWEEYKRSSKIVVLIWYTNTKFNVTNKLKKQKLRIVD